MVFKIALFFFPLILFAKGGYFEPWGKDSKLRFEKKEEQNESLSIIAKAAHQAILFHQNVISPVDGPRSSFRPTSARYTYHAIRRFGFFKGFVMGCDRLMRENDEDWVYRKVLIDGKLYKWDPPKKKYEKLTPKSQKQILFPYAVFYPLENL